MAARHRRSAVVLLSLVVTLAASPSPVMLATLDPPTNGISLAPNLRVSNGVVLLTWLERVTPDAKVPRHRLRISTLTDRSWSAPVTIHESTAIVASSADVPSVQVSEDGTYLAHWAEMAGSAHHAYDVVLGSSKDGRTWTRLGVAHDDKTETEHGFVSMTPAKGSGVRAFWLDGRDTAGGKPGATALRTAVVDAKVSPSEVIDPRVCDCCGTGAAETSDGPVVVYRDRDESEIRDISIVRRVGDRWSAPAQVARDGWKIAGCPVNGPSVDAFGRKVAVAWFTAATTPEVRATFSDDGGASFGPVVRIDEPSKAGALGRVDVALTDLGEAIVTWLEGIDDKRARVRARRVSADGRRGPAIDVISTVSNHASGFPQIVRRKDELMFTWTEVAANLTRVRAGTLPLAAVPPVATTTDAGSSAGAGTIAAYRAHDLGGKPVDISKLAGKATLINVWATWCLPCREEVPALNALHARYGKRGLDVVGVSVDEQKDRAGVDRFVRDAKVAYAVWLDPENLAQAVLGAAALPITLLVDRAGRVLWRLEGKIDADSPEARAAIEAALGIKS